jgi:hypothetical protein
VLNTRSSLWLWLFNRITSSGLIIRSNTGAHQSRLQGLLLCCASAWKQPPAVSSPTYHSLTAPTFLLHAWHQGTPEDGSPGYFLQRVFVCAEYWRAEPSSGTLGPIFFYLGNEADVTLWVSALFWDFTLLLNRPANCHERIAAAIQTYGRQG